MNYIFSTPLCFLISDQAVSFQEKKPTNEASVLVFLHNLLVWAAMLLFIFGANTSYAQCSLTLKAKVSGCYQSGNSSKATVTVEVGWTNPPSGQTIVVTGPAGSVPATRTITPGTITVQYNDTKNTFVNSTQTIVSPQLVAFEIPANGASGLSVSAAFSSTSSCNATSNTFNAPAACQPVECASGQIGGTVFFDYNADGTKQSDEIETGVSGVAVKVTDKNGATYTTTSVKYGRWRLSVPANAYPVRVEFSSLPSYAGQGTQNGKDGNTTVQFIGAPDCTVDLGVLDNIDFTNNKPDIYVPCYVNGDPLAGGGAAGLDALVKFDYDASGAKDMTKITPLATAAEVGSLWGLAYNKYKQTLFAAATVKRHVGLGPKGLGGLYVINPNTSAVVTSWNVTTDMGINVGTIGNNASRNLPAGTTTGSEDVEGFTKLGKVGIGDIDLNEAGSQLFLTNLFDKKLYKIDLSTYNASGTKPTASNVTSYTLPNVTCTSGELRPFGVKWFKNAVFVGAVCDASVTKNKSNLRAYVFKLNLATNTWATIFDFPLTYPKGFPTADKRDGTGWYPWTDDFGDFLKFNNSSGRADVVYPQPMLTDIEIDSDGSMILGFGDRGGMQTGYRNRGTSSSDNTQYTGFVGGDILRAFDNGVGSYVLENAAKAGPNMGYAPTNNQGPGFGEYYNDDWYNGDGTPKLRHSECVIGGLALRPGAGEVIVGIVDPVDGINWSGGVRHYNNYTGLTENAFVLYRTTDGDGATQGKAAGLGDIELGIAVPEFIEVGNRIWLDNDGDGIQDPTEPGIDGVTVTLCSANGATIATAVTANGGQYYFSNAAGTSTGNTKYGLNLQPNTTYKLKIPAIFNFNDLTDPNQGTDNIDSDFIISGTKAEVTITTGNEGVNNHTYDAGYVPTPIAPKGSWKFTCADGMRVETKGTGNAAAASNACNNSTAPDVTLTLNFANTSNIDSIVVEAIYKNDNPGPTITFKDAANVSYIANRYLLPGLGDAWVYRVKVPATSSVKLTETNKPCSLQSMVAYAFRQEAGYASVGEFTCIQGYKNTKTITLDLPARTKVSDMTVCLPISELTTDGRPLTIKATAGSVTNQVTINGPDGSLNTCCLDIVKIDLNNVPTAPTTVTIEVVSPSSPEGQSYTIAAAAQVVVLCEKCVKPTAGPDVAICTPATTVDLPNATTDQTWVVGTKPSGTTPAITSAGLVSGMTANGTYQFILRTSDVTCSDTVVVTRKPKPSAGPDQSICSPTTTAALGAAPSGAAWSAQSGNPASATIGSTNGNVSGMTANGTYKFILTQNGCADTVAITRNAKPAAGTDKKICAPATNASLGAAPSGGTWSAQSGNPAAATVGSSNGNVAGMTANGNYKFILTVNGCTDTVMVTRNPAPTISATPICNPGLLTYNITVTTTNATSLTSTSGTVSGTAPNFTVSNVNVGTNVTLTANNTSTTCSATQAVNSPNCSCPAVTPTASDVSRCGPGQVTMTATGTSTCNTLRWYANSTGGTVLGTGASFTRTVADDSTFYVACFNTASACESPRKAVNITVVPKPNAGAGQSICEPATTANLTDAQSGQQWVAQAGNPAAATINATTGAVTGMTANGLYYFILRSTADNNCADTVIVDRNPKPNAGPDQTVCAPATSIDLPNAPSGGAWSAQAGNPAAATIAASTGIVSGMTADGTYKFILTVDGCKDTVAVTRNNKPNAGNNQTICAPATTASLGAAPSGATWSVMAGNPAAATVGASTGAVVGMTADGVYQFILTEDGCKDTVSITRNPKPNAGGDQSICAPATTASLGAAPAGGSWTPRAGNPATATVNASTGAVTGMSANGTYRFILTLNGCTDTVAIVRNAKPVAGTDKKICAPATSVALGAAPAGGAWSAQTGNPATTTVNASTGAVSGMTANGNYKFILTLNGCTDTVMVTRNPAPTIVATPTCNPGLENYNIAVTTTNATSLTASAGTVSGTAPNFTVSNVPVGTNVTLTANNTTTTCSSTQTVNSPNCTCPAVPPTATDVSRCGPGQVTLTATGNASCSVVRWYAEAADANPIQTGTSLVVTVTADEDYFVACYNTAQDCESTRKAVQVTVTPKPNAGTDAEIDICAPQTTYNFADAQAGQEWVAQTGNPAAATINATTGAVAGMTANGTYKFILRTIAEPTCADTAIIVRNAKPNAGQNQKLCAPATSLKLSTAPAGGTWMAQTGNPATATINTSTGQVNGMTANGTYNFILTIGECTDTVAVTRYAKPNAGADVAICEPATTTDLTDAPSGSSWAVMANNPAAATVNATTGVIAGMTTDGTYRFILTNTVSGCTDTVAVVRKPKPDAGPDQNICQPATTASLDTAPAGSAWSAMAGNPAAATINASTGVVAGMTINGTYKFILTEMGCTDTVQITRNAKPNAGTDKKICSPATTAALGAAPAGSSWAIVAGNPAAATVNASTGAVAGMSANGSYKFALNSATGCSDTVIVARNPQPTISASPVCNPGLTTYNITVTTTNATSLTATVGTVTGTAPNFTVSNIPIASSVTLTANNSSTTCSATRNVTPPNCACPAVPPTVADVTRCGPGQVSFTATGDASCNTIRWYAVETGGSSIATGATFTATIADDSTFYVTCFNTAQNCESSRKAVMATITTKPSAGADVAINVCNPLTTADLPNAQAGQEWVVQTGNPAAATINATTGAIAGMTANGTYKFIIRTISDPTCSDTATVIRQPKPNAGADRTICEPATTTNLVDAAVGGQWTALAGNPANATINSSTGVVSGMTVNGNYRFVLASAAGCTDTILVRRSPQPNAGTDVSLCEPETATNLPDAPAGASWSAQAGNPTAATINATTGAVTGMTTNGTYKFILTSGTCRDTVSVIRNPRPNAGPDVLLCGTNSTNLPDAPAGGAWSAMPDNPVAATINATSGVASGMTANGVYTFVLTANGCTDTVEVTRNPKPNTGANKAICEPETSIDLVNAISGQEWIAQAGNPAAATINATTGVVNGMTANGAYKFILRTITDPNCSDTITVTRNPKPAAGPDIELCAPASTADLPDAPAGATWTAQAGNPKAVTLNATTGVVSGMTTSGTYKFILTLNGCKDTVAVTRNAKPNAGANKRICEPTTTFKLPNITNGDKWSVLSKPAAATNVAINDTTGAVTGMTANGTYNFVWTTAAGCKDTVAIIRSGLPTIVATPVCNPDGLTYNITVKTTNTTTFTASVGIVAGTNPNYTVSGIPIDSASVLLKASNVAPGCTTEKVVVAPNCAKGSLGDYVWKDANNNGKQDDNEDGVKDVILQIFKNGSATVFATDTTDASGQYSFANLDSASYQVKILLSSLPTDCQLSTKANEAGVPDSLDSDFTISGTTAVSQTVVIDPKKGGIDKDNPTIDAGLVFICVTPTITITQPPLCSTDNSKYTVQFTVSAGSVSASVGTLTGTGTGPYTLTVAAGQNAMITVNAGINCITEQTVQAPNCGCPIPQPIIVANSILVCEGEQLPKLVATVSAGATVDWYDAPTGGNKIATGTLEYQPTKAGNYYAEARNLTIGCTSVSRTPATVSITIPKCIPVTVIRKKR